MVTEKCYLALIQINDDGSKLEQRVNYSDADNLERAYISDLFNRKGSEIIRTRWYDGR